MLAGGYLTLTPASFVRPGDTNAYASGDLVANSVTATAVVPLVFDTMSRFPSGGKGLLRGASLYTGSVSITTASFRLHFFTPKRPIAPSENPTFANGDNSAFSVSNVAQYLGKIDLTLDQAFTDGAWGAGVPLVGAERPFDLGGGNRLLCAVEARSAYTPVSADTFTVTPYILQL